MERRDGVEMVHPPSDLGHWHYALCWLRLALGNGGHGDILDAALVLLAVLVVLGELVDLLLLPECLLFRWGGRGRDEIDVGSQGCLCVLCSDGSGNRQRRL